MRLAFFGLSFAVCIGMLSSQQARAQGQAEAPFAEEIHVFAMEDEIFPPEACGTLFVGSSSIRFWFRLAEDFAGERVVRRGFGGSTIADVNFYFDQVVSRYRPARIVFYAGENDLNAGRSPDDVFQDFMRFMDLKDAALGSAPVYFVSVKPSVARISDLPRQTILNAKVDFLAGERSDLAYIDIASPMLANGLPAPDLFVSDRLHMNAHGYDIWRNEILGVLNEDGVTRAQYCR
jgi:lysophospholipase L1-like esterase